MACFPVCPRYSKMLVLSKQQDLLPLIIAIIAALTIGEIFTEHFDENDLSKSDLNESNVLFEIISAFLYLSLG